MLKLNIYLIYSQIQTVNFYYTPVTFLSCSSGGPEKLSNEHCTLSNGSDYRILTSYDAAL